MTAEETLMQDKWLEAVYHLKKMKEEWENLNSVVEKKQDTSRNFKYEFNAFINSIRSVTFVIQKCFKNKHSDFDNWYSEIQNELKANEFAKTINDLRNINQKEGNKHPDIIIVKRINDFFNFEVTYTPIPPHENEHLKTFNLTLEQKLLVPKNLTNADIVPVMDAFDINLEYEPEPNDTYEEIKEKMTNILITETFKEISTKKSLITEEELKNMVFSYYKLGIFDKKYTWEEFYKECNDILEFLKNKCQESIKLFK